MLTREIAVLDRHSEQRWLGGECIHETDNLAPANPYVYQSPKNSMMGIYPTGHGSKAVGSRLSVGFGPDMPDYSQIAVAAGGAWGRRVSEPEKLKETIEEAIRVVLKEKRCAVLDCIIKSI